MTLAKIGLSDVDNKRGYEMTVTGSGFNDGTTAGVYVLANARFEVAKWWNPGLREDEGGGGLGQRTRGCFNGTPEDEQRHVLAPTRGL